MDRGCGQGWRLEGQSQASTLVKCRRLGVRLGGAVVMNGKLLNNMNNKHSGRNN